MPEFQASIPIAHQQLEDGLCLSEAVGFSEVSCLAPSAEAATKSARVNLVELLKETPTSSWSRHWLPESPQPLEIRLKLSPASRTTAWHEPVELLFPAVRWRQADDAWLAFIPALGIEVLSPREDELPRRIDEQIRSALMRLEATKSLRTLAFAQRASALEIEIVELKHEVKTPKRAAQDDDAGREQRESVLEKIATSLAKTNVSDLFERDSELRQLADLLSGRHPRSVLLVGASGVGKTAIVRGLSRLKAAFGLPSYSFWETGGSRIVAGMTGFGMWQERCRHLLEEVAKRASAHETVVLHVGPLLELMEVGQSEGNSQGIANFLRPPISRGELLVVAECTPEQLAVFERRDPHLLHAFAQLHIDEPTVEQNRRILEQVARTLWPVAHAARVRPESALTDAREPSALQADVLDTLDRLHRRYATYSANPGRPLRFLRALRQDHSLADGPLTPARVTTAFARETGLPLWLIDDSSLIGTQVDNCASGPKGRNSKAQGKATNGSDALGQEEKKIASPERAKPQSVAPSGLCDSLPDNPGRRGSAQADPLCPGLSSPGLSGQSANLLDEPSPHHDELANWFAARVIGQPEAVTAVTDLLAVVKAGLHRERKPLASFLFIGPTGVGKTEMAKALAEFLFGDPQRMVRVDLSEYADELAVQRLIGGTISDEGWLTSRVREQPFAVVLLDEFEKAHPAFFDLLLQVLSDGRLTDAAGRVADSRNCVIIMTSNLGAATFHKGSVGFNVPTDARQTDREHFVKAVREFVRPELFNRVDAVVPFGAIDNGTARRIVERQLQLLRQRDGWRSRRLTLDIAPSVAEHLLVTGFDRRYGARSLKRVLERELLAPLSEQLNGYTGDTALRGEIGVSGEQLSVTVRAQAAESGRTIRSLADAGREDVSLPRIRDLRRRTSRLMNSAVAVELRNQLFRLSKLEARQQRRPTRSPNVLQRLGQHDALAALMTRITRLAESAVELEDAALIRLYAAEDGRLGLRPDPAAEPTPRTVGTESQPTLPQLEADFRELLFDVHERSNDSPKQIRLGLYGDQRAWSRLLTAYLIACETMQAKVEVWRLVPPNAPRETPPPEFWNSEFLKWQWVEAKADRASSSQRSDEGVQATGASFWRLVFQRPELAPAWMLEAHPVRSPLTWLAEPDQGSLGVILNVTGPRVFARFVGESGAHQFTFPSERRQCVVATALSDWKTYLPPRGIDRRGGLDGEPTRREYDDVKSTIADSDDPHPLSFGRNAFDAAVVALLEARHVRDAEGLIE